MTAYVTLYVNNVKLLNLTVFDFISSAPEIIPTSSVAKPW